MHMDIQEDGHQWRSISNVPGTRELIKITSVTITYNCSNQRFYGALHRKCRNVLKNIYDFKNIAI